MPITWTSAFDLDLPGIQVAEMATVARDRRHGFRRSGLRGLRVGRDSLRTRYVIGAAASAPLLKAALTDTPNGARMTGRVRWGASYLMDTVYLAGLAAVGMMGLWFAWRDRAWGPLLLGAAALALAVGLIRVWLRAGSAVRRRYLDGFESALRETFSR